MPSQPQQIPSKAQEWLRSQQGQQGPNNQQYPFNLIAENLLPEEVQKKVFQWVQTNYIWPQVCERMSFEPLWDKILKLARINIDDMDLNVPMDSAARKSTIDEGRKNAKVSDSLIFDAIDRLTNINHFISFKEGLPMQFVRPEYYLDGAETSVYHPLEDRIKAGNCILEWNAANEDYYLKHLIACRHHYTYGVAFARSEFVYEVAMQTRQNNNGQVVQVPEITRVGTTFDPISIRKLWLNFRIPAWEMDNQPCPFYFEEMPWFALLQKTYDPNNNPFGFVNLEKLQPKSYIYSSQELNSVRKGMEERVTKILEILRKSGDSNSSLPNVLSGEYSVDALWTLYPMIPLDENTGDFEKYPSGQPVPMKRYIMQTYGSNLATNQVLLRLQRNFYPKDGLPIYGSSHMPDLDAGLYTPCLGELLWNHYKEIVTCTSQYIENKDWINDPPAWVQISSPAAEEDLTRKGAKLKVNGPNDFGWRQPYDATASTVQLRSMLREEAQTTSKAVDAILGKAMGGRTSATEASNAYQASMSGITTDINIFNHQISGGYAQRIWDYTALWINPQLLEAITGQFGFALKPEDMWLNLSIKTNVGSQYISAIVRQQNLRAVSQDTLADPTVNRVALNLQVFEAMGFDDPESLVNDNDTEHEIIRATMQAQKTYLGMPVAISPDQNHQIAIKVKTAFIEDQDSAWNEKNPQAIPQLIQQINLHQQFAMLQMQQQLAMQQINMKHPGGGGGIVDPAQGPMGKAPGSQQTSPQTPGQVTQQAQG